mgnify:CR=1 FL=1
MKHALVMLITLMVCITNTAIASEDGLFFDFHGKPQSVESFMGDDKWLVMMIWAANCHICNEEAESYARLHENNKNIRVLGLSIDGLANKGSAESFIETHDLPFPNLISNTADVMLYYQAQTVAQFVGTPTFLVFNPDGELMAAKTGAVPTKVIQKFIASKSSSSKLN